MPESTGRISFTARIARVLLLLLLAAAACSSPPPGREPVAITFAARGYQRDWYQELAEAFHEEHPRVVVQIVSVEEILGQTEIGSVVTVSSDDIVKVADAADTMVQPAAMLGERPQDILLDLADLAAHDGEFVQEDFYPAALALFQRGDKLWGLPSEVGTLLLYYNAKLFDEAGVPHPQPGWTWDDLLDAAARLTIREGDRVQQYGYVDRWPFYTLPLLAHQRAGPLIVTEYEVTQARLDDPRVAEAMRWYADLALSYGVMPDPTATEQADLQRLVYEGFPAMWTGFAYEWDNFKYCCDASVMPLPKDGEPAAYISANGYLISAGAAHPAEAWHWIEFLTRQPPYRYSHGVSARRSAAGGGEQGVGSDPALAAAFQHNLDRAVDYPGLIGGALGRAFEAVLQGDPAQAVLAQAQAEANAALARIASEAEEPGESFTVARQEPTPTPGGRAIRFYVPSTFGTDWGVYQALADRFHQERPAIALDIESGPVRSLAQYAASADCFVERADLAHGEVPGTIHPLDPLIAADPAFDRDVFYPAYLGQVEVDGMLWGLPLETDASLLYYNRSLFDRVEMSYPATDWTPLELVEAAAALTEADASPPIYGFYPRDGAYGDAPQYVAWLGGQLFDAEGHPTFDDPTVVEALGQYATLILDASPPTAQNRSGDRWAGYTVTVGGHPGQVSSGRTAMWVDRFAYHRGALPLDFEVGAAPLPAGAAPLEQPSLRALFVSAQTFYPEACWAWIAFLSAQPEAVQWLPVRRDIAAGDAWWGDATTEVVDAWRSVLDRDGALPPPQRYGRALYWFDQALADMLTGTLPLEALAAAQAKAAAFVNCLEGDEDTPDAWRACAQQADPDLVLPSNQ